MTTDAHQTAGNRSNAEVLDILFAVALGEGFITGIYEYKAPLLSGEVFASTELSQGFCRVLLSFLIIILSWLHFRSTTLSSRDYPSGEFVVDVLVAMSYMALFLFVDAPVVFYATVTGIWFLYALARVLSGQRSLAYLTFGLGFVAFFLAATISAGFGSSDNVEWIRLALVTLAIIAYRPLDRRVSARTSTARV